MIECYGSQVLIANVKKSSKINKLNHNQATAKHSTLLGSSLFWNALKGKEQWYGAIIGTEYAEGFWSDNPMQLFDPISNFIKPIK